MSVIGRRAMIGDGAEVQGSIIGDGAQVGSRAKLKNCFVAEGFQVPEAVIAEGNFFGF
jgi:ADP-glucose pyrophosphorylase